MCGFSSTHRTTAFSGGRSRAPARPCRGGPVWPARRLCALPRSRNYPESEVSSPAIPTGRLATSTESLLGFPLARVGFRRNRGSPISHSLIFKKSSRCPRPGRLPFLLNHLRSSFHPLQPAIPARGGPLPKPPPLYSGMSEILKNVITNVTGQIERRRGMGILKKTPGALGEPPALLNSIEANTASVGRRGIEEIAGREPCRHGKGLSKAGPREIRRHVDTVARNLTHLRTTDNEPRPLADATFPFTSRSRQGTTREPDGIREPQNGPRGASARHPVCPDKSGNSGQNIGASDRG